MAGRRFTRYFQDAAFREAVDEQFAKADAASVPGLWITYAIHDPTRADHIGGEPDGLIIYVGQSKEFGKRVRKRMRNAGTAVRRPPDRIDGACYDVMAKGPPPRFSVRETTTTAIDSLISETNTAKRFLAAGYPLLNQWTEQKFSGREIDRYSVPHGWLWPMTAADALGSAVDLIMVDPMTGAEVQIDLTAWPEKDRLRDIRSRLQAATGRRPKLHVR